MGSSQITSQPTLTLLGVEFDTNFTTIPYLQKLEREASTRAALLSRLSYAMPPHLLKTFANGLLMGKILASCPVTIPVKLNHNDNLHGYIGVIEDINKSIKATARAITKTKLSDKIRSEVTLQKANLKCLNEAVASVTAVTVWKSKQSMNPLGQCLFREPKTNTSRTIQLRSDNSTDIRPPVPGYPMLASNIMTNIWNNAPELQSATTLAAAKRAAHKWAKGLPKS